MNALRSLPSTGFMGGLALASPYVADILPWAIAGLLFVPWAIMVLVTRNFESPLRVSPVLWIGVFLLTAHLLALLLTETPFVSSVLKESAIAAAVLCVGILTQRDIRVADGFFSVLIGLGIGTAVLGLVKLGLQDRGYLLWFVIQACPDQYPQGSNLCTDYNLLGMLWLVTSLGLVGWRLRSNRFVPLILLSITLAAGLAVGSRRFLTLVLLVPVFWIAMTFKLRSWGGVRREFVLVILVAAASWILNLTISDPHGYERFRFGAEPMTILGGPDVENPDELTANMKNANRAGAGVIAGTILDGGLDSRLGRWQLGLNSFLESPVVGRGFTYHQTYAVATPIGLAKDYPHLPILSEGLIGGFGLILLTLIMYAILTREAIVAPKWLQETGLPIALFAVTAVTAISGDTIFSLPHWIATAVALTISGQLAQPYVQPKANSSHS